MITLEDVYEIVEDINNDAHQQAWDLWIEADELEESSEEDDWIIAEERREEASEKQSEYFRADFWRLEEDKVNAVKHWLKKDEDFKEQFACYYGYEAFEEELEDE